MLHDWSEMDIQAFMNKRYGTETREGHFPHSDNFVDFAELARNMHYAVATSGRWQIAHCNSDVYKASRTMFLAAIQAAYPNLPTTEIYDVWVDCNESVAYCATAVKNRIADYEDWVDESDNEWVMGERGWKHNPSGLND